MFSFQSLTCGDFGLRISIVIFFFSTNFPKVKTTVEWKSKRKTNPSSFKFRQNFTTDNLEFPWSENSLVVVRFVPMSSSRHIVSQFRHFLYIYTPLTGIFCEFRTICLCHNAESICHNSEYVSHVAIQILNNRALIWNAHLILSTKT
jgi:hypothetical protein